MVHKAVYSGNHHRLVGENLIPLSKWLICGDQQRASLITRTDQLEQNAGLGVILVNVREIVEHQEIIFVELSDGCFKLKRLASLLQPLHEVGGAHEQRTIAGFDKSATNRRPEMRFPGTRRPETNQVGALLQPSAAGGKRHDACLAEHRNCGKIEAVEGLAGRQSGLDEMPFNASAPAFGEFQLRQGGEESRPRPAFLIGSFGKFTPQPGDGRQSQLMQQQRQACGVDLDRAHGCSHSCGALSKAS